MPDIPYPYTRLLTDALIAPTLNILFLGFLMFWERQQFFQMDEKTRELRDAMQKDREYFDKQVNESKTAMDKNTATFARVKVILLARMSDYSRELNFWRDTVRKVLYGMTGGKEAGESLVKHVTESLQTHRARTGVEDDFDTMKVLAGLMLKDSTREKGSENGT